MPSEESVVRYFLLLLLLLPTSSSFLFPCFGLFSLSLITRYVNISILSKAFLESGCVCIFLCRLLFHIKSGCLFFLCLFLIHIKSSYSVLCLYSHTAAFHCDRAHTKPTNRHPAPVTGTDTGTVTGWLQANEMELVLTHYVRARGLEYDSLYGWAEILTPFMSVAMTRGKNDRMHCTLHAARCTLHTAHYTLHATRYTLHATRYTLHPLCKYLDRFYGAHCRLTIHYAPPSAFQFVLTSCIVYFTSSP